MSTELTEAAANELARFPIGRFHRPEAIAPESVIGALATLAELPTQLRNAVGDLSDAQLETTYRDGGWTLRQVVHHLADSHMNAFIRIRLALTEDSPMIKPYDEAAWAKLPDSAAPVEWSVNLLESLHARWVMLLRSLDEAQWQRVYVHPENGTMTVEMTALLYAWHSRHHLAHILQARSRHNW